MELRSFFMEKPLNIQNVNKKRVTLGVLALGVVLGIGSMLTFDAAMHVTSTDTFCVSCHEMQIPNQALQKTSHFSNRSGVVAGCSDCHLPHPFVPKMIRKVEAAREVYGHLTGMIDTPEKYAAHREKMQQREISRLKANDSAECRYCHDTQRMDVAKQSSVAVKRHAKLGDGETCIDCHQGIAHGEVADEAVDFSL